MVQKRTTRRSGVVQVRAAWASLMDGLRALGWDVVQPRAFQAYYRTSDRVGTVGIYDRGDGIWRYVVDGYSVRCRSRLKMIDPTRPAAFRGTLAMHEITLLAAEVELVTEWLLRWIVAYDAGQPLPDMPDGTPYPGGYVWTVARGGVA